MVSPIDRRRAEAIAARRRVTAKISREAKKGIKLTGTDYDIRKSADQVRKMSSAQLSRYLAQTNQFLDRQTRFIKTAGGPVSTQDFNVYKNVESRVGKLAEAEFDKYRNRKVLGSNNTVEQRAKLYGNKGTAANETTNRPLSKVVREAKDINGLQGLKTLTKDLEKKLTKAYAKDAIKKTRRTAIKTFTIIGDPRLLKWVKGLSNDHLNFLWNYGGLAQAAYSRYPEPGEQVNDGRGYDAISDASTGEIEEAVAWTKEDRKKS